MQIHELNTFEGTPSATDYLAIDDGTETNKVPATALGVSTQMTQAEAEAGTVTAPRVVTPSVFKSAVTAIASAISGVFVSMTTPKYTLNTSATSGDDYNLTQALTSLGWLSDVVTSGALGMKKLLHKILQKLNEPTEASYIVETVPLTFSSGSATLSKKDGYVLVSAYPRNRTDSVYGITDWTEQTNGSYILNNKYTSLNAGMAIRTIWVKDA